MPVEAIPVPVEVPVLVQGRGVVHVNDGQQGVGDHSTPGGWRGYQGQTQVLNINQIKEKGKKSAKSDFRKISHIIGKKSTNSGHIFGKFTGPLSVSD